MAQPQQPGLELIDAPLLRVPLESLKRVAKERKALVDEAGEALAALAESSGGGSGGGGAANGAAAPQPQQQLDQLDQLLGRLQGIKRKLSEAADAEQADAARLKARLEHLVALGPGPRPAAGGAGGAAGTSGGAVAWNRPRLDRLIADHLLREGLHQTAAALAASANAAPLVDAAMFEAAARVASALRARDCGPALEWCAAQRARLRKLKSPLEFRLRLREFVALVAGGRRLDAVAHARRHLAPWASQGHMPELQRALGALAFGPATRVPRYAALFDDAAWTDLANLFDRELLRLHCAPPASPLAVHLQAGLAALKTPAASVAGCSRDDPLHLPSFQKLADGLPCAKHVTSKLVCAVTRRVMNEDNPPMVLPNGYVYSARAVEAIAARHGGGRVVCPHTGSVYGLDELRRAFVL